MRKGIRIFAVSCLGLVATIFMFNSTASADLDTGLAAYYPFSGNANDESGNGNNGTVYGATLTTDRFGASNSAYHFDGGDDYILSSAALLPTAERTVALWFYADQVGNMPNLIGYGGSDTEVGASWLMGINAWGAPAYSVTCHWDINTLQYYYPQEPVGEWFHYVITTDSSGTKIYINGVEKAANSTFINNTGVAGADLAIGVAVDTMGLAPYVDGNVGYFQGSLDDVRIYNRALSAAEIQELYGSPVPAEVIVISPNGGETWNKGTTHPITWTSTASGGTVTIKLMNGTATKKTITTSASNSGSYSWKVPRFMRSGSTYTIQIIWNDNTDVFDESDNPFTITK